MLTHNPFTTINNLSSSHENLSSANSRIRDTDVAAESAQFTRSQILAEAWPRLVKEGGERELIALLGKLRAARGRSVAEGDFPSIMRFEEGIETAERKLRGLVRKEKERVKALSRGRF